MRVDGSILTFRNNVDIVGIIKDRENETVVEKNKRTTSWKQTLNLP